MTDLLFDVPWWIPTLLIVAGLALWVSGNRRQIQKSRNAGLVLIAIAIAWSVMSYLVDTPKETCQKQTRQFVQSVVDRNWTVFDRLLDPNVSFELSQTNWSMIGRDSLDAAIKPDIQSVGVKTAHVTSMTTTQTGDIIKIDLTVLSTQEKTMDEPMTSDWEFDWQKSDGRWLLQTIRCNRISNVSQDEARRSLPVNR